MAARVLSAVKGGAIAAPVPVRRALVSVFDKSGVLDLCRNLADQGVEILSTGGTAKSLREAGVAVTDVADVTDFPEILDGRVKTLHPAIHGPLLAVRGNEAHESDLKSHRLGAPIDVVVTNLYPFEQAAAGAEIPDSREAASEVIENIDIGGPTMLRAAAKNHSGVAVLSSPEQYDAFLADVVANNGSTSAAMRRSLAAQAFALSARYDAAVAQWMTRLASDEAAEAEANGASPLPGAAVRPVVFRSYVHHSNLKYGNNPHQGNAGVFALAKGTGGAAALPFEVLNGAPGYINLLDALNSWQLVRELRQGLGQAAAASFKHVSPAGAALGVPLSDQLAAAYDASTIAKRVPGGDLTPAALAYLRARNADPLCSFGDFVALSDVVDEATALIIKPEVSDGIIAPGYEPEALKILNAKKKGGFIVLQADPDAELPADEWRELHGVALRQRRNTFVYTPENLGKPETSSPEVTDAVRRDLTLAATTVKYTQSNSVGFAAGGQMIGIGAGQQSRVDCVKLAARKAQTWWMRQHNKVLELPFKAGTKRQARVNARVQYIEGTITATEHAEWLKSFDEEPELISAEEREAWLAALADEQVCLASDAFFPFRDGIDAASTIGTKFVTQPGGSIGDAAVIRAAEEYGMAMLFHGMRSFHH